jgi:hypothetical protein
MALYALWPCRILGDGSAVHRGFACDLDFASRSFSAHTLASGAVLSRADRFAHDACTPTDDSGNGHRAAIHCRCPVSYVVAAIRVMMGPDDVALLRLARAATAERHLVTSAAQHEREARAAAAQRRLVAYWTPLAAPLPARFARLIIQLETQDVSA